MAEHIRINARTCLLSLVLLLAAAPAAHAAIGFRSAATATAGSAHSITVATPDGVQPGDVLIATVAAGGPRIALTSSGWTPIRTTDAGAALDQLSFYRVATTTESASHTFAAASGTNELAAGISAYSGVDVANPIDVVGDASRAAATSIPSVTTTGDGDVVVGAIALASSVTVTPDPSLASRYAPALPKAQIVVGDFVQVTAGATSPLPFTTGGKAGEKSVQAIALRPGAVEEDSGGLGSDAMDPSMSGWTLFNGQPLSAEVLATLPVLTTPVTPRISAAGAVPVTVACPTLAIDGCSGAAALFAVDAPEEAVVAARRRRVGRKRTFRLVPGAKKTLPLRLDRRTIRRVMRGRRTRLQLRVTVHTTAGPAVKVTTVTVRARRSARRFASKRRRR
jgi:hypothetical protein